MKRQRGPVERISTAQLAILSGAVGLGTVFLPITSIIAKLAGSDATLALIAAGPVVAVVGRLAHIAQFKFPRQSLVAQFELAFGRLIGRALALPLGLATIAFAAGLERQIADVYIIALMPKTPPWVFALAIAGLAGALAHEGVEALARYVAITHPLVLATLVILVAAAAPLFNWHHFLPPLEHGLAPALKGFARALPFAGEVVLFVWAILPNVNQPRGGPRAVTLGSLPTIAILIALNAATIGALSAPETARLFYATIDLAKLIQIGDYLRGLEAIIIPVFTAATVTKTAAFLLAGSRIVGDCLGVADARPVVWPLTLAATAGALALTKATTMLRFIDSLDWYVMLPTLFLPFLVWPLAFLRSKRLDKRTVRG